MVENRIGEIRISKRVVWIGHQVYPLANISRVQTLHVVWSGKYATWYPLGGITLLVLLYAVIVVGAQEIPPLPDLDVDTEAVRQVAGFLLVACAAGIAYLVGVLLYRLLIRKPRYALVVETAGTQYTALSGTDEAEIHRIEWTIVAAIEDPPQSEQVVQIHGDVVLGDKHIGHRFGRNARIGKESDMSIRYQ